MRTLVVSDIHGNWPALEAVAAVPHDAVVCLGDVVGYGPQPGACLRWLRASHAIMVQGNHDRALADDVPPRCRPDFESLAAAAAGIARQQLDHEQVAWLRTQPRALRVAVDGRRAFLAHATPDEPLYRYLGPDPDAWRSAVEGLDVELALVGHIHVPFHFQFGPIHVVNPGSVGQPKDGDPRASYALVEDGVPRLERASYPVERTVDALGAAGLDAGAFQALAELLRSGRIGSSAPFLP